MLRLRLTALLGLMVLGMSFLALAIPVQAAGATQTYQNEKTGQCLGSFEPNSAKDGVFGIPCTNSTTVKWNVQRNKDGTVTLINQRTGLCLDSNHSKEVYTHTCNGGAFQHWFVGRNDNGTITFWSKATGYCLDTNSTNNVYTLECNKGSHQRWR